MNLPIEDLSSKTQIKKLGKAIRSLQKTGHDIPNEYLLGLQNYRTSFQPDISEVFNILSEVSRRVRKDRVVTYRIKRIESIISKIHRQPTMQLDTMGDIAGCRCILQTDAAIFKIIDGLEKKLQIRKRNDYLTSAKADGYRAYHLYVESPINPTKQIEIQLRSQECHNWSTLVEILDVLYDKKLKEGQKEPGLEEFLLLMSHREKLTYDQKCRILEIEAKYQIYASLSSLFSKNYLTIRNAWFILESKSDHTYFVISVDKTKTPTIQSYNNYEQAEESYFNIFKSSQESNVVLTHLDEVNFRKLCIAYSNYILIKHSFLTEWQQFMLEQIETLYTAKQRRKANEVVNYFQRTLKEESNHIRTEIAAIRKIMDNRNVEHFFAEDTKLDEWLIEMEDNIAASQSTENELVKLLDKHGRSSISQFFY
jgi:ppGpp synthetase/RelA/SpoT-type nucleotidyltranferase